MRNRARQLRANLTPAEQWLWQAIRYDQCDGLRFRRQCVKGQYITEFYCPALRMVIEVDGSVHDLPEQKVHDEMRTLALGAERRIHVFRLRNEEILTVTSEELRQCVRQFAQTLRQNQDP